MGNIGNALCKLERNASLWADKAGGEDHVKGTSEQLLPVPGTGLMSESCLDLILDLLSGWALHGGTPRTAAGSPHAASK